MLHLIVSGRRGGYELHLPTEITEIPLDYLKNVTSNVHVADNYSLVALVYREQLPIVLNSIKKNTQLTTNCVPLLVKSGNTDSEFVQTIPEGSVIVAVGSVLARGIHVSSNKNKLTMANIASICEGDVEIGKKAFTLKDYCCFLEFKLIANCDINGYYSIDNTTIEDAFVVKVPTPQTNTLN